jgi:hypothetical protein
MKCKLTGESVEEKCRSVVPLLKFIPGCESANAVMMTYKTKISSEPIAVDRMSNADDDHLEDDNVGVDKFDRSSHNGC